MLKFTCIYGHLFHFSIFVHISHDKFLHIQTNYADAHSPLNYFELQIQQKYYETHKINLEFQLTL